MNDPPGVHARRAFVSRFLRQRSPRNAQPIPRRAIVNLRPTGLDCANASTRVFCTLTLDVRKGAAPTSGDGITRAVDQGGGGEHRAPTVIAAVPRETVWSSGYRGPKQQMRHRCRPRQ